MSFRLIISPKHASNESETQPPVIDRKGHTEQNCKFRWSRVILVSDPLIRRQHKLNKTIISGSRDSFYCGCYILVSSD